MYISTVNKLSENATCPPVASDQVPVGPGGVPAIPGIHATGLYPTLKSGQHNETSRQKSVSSFTAASGTDTIRYCDTQPVVSSGGNNCWHQATYCLMSDYCCQCL